MAKRRITRVTTRRGDSGETTLADGSRIAKTDSRMHAIGDVDELNSFIGLLITTLSGEHALHPTLERLQQELFDLGAHLATKGAVDLPDMGWLDEAIETLNADLPPLTEFVIPGGTTAASTTHVCRTVCRRAERHCWSVEDATPAARYLNRLSDLLFVMARSLNSGIEPQWRGPS